ncbi:MAG: hypothetical protein H7222_08040 [Methylotenera sp.]|nr:hypothetical protein [Oligoflexia bacterium]
MFYQKKVVGLSLSIVMVTLTACGASTGTVKDDKALNVSGTGGYTNSGSSPGSGTGPTVSNLPPAIRKTFSITGGTGSYETTIPSTDAQLSVRVSATDGGQVAISGSNFTTAYSCASYDVTLSVQDTSGYWHDTETVTTKRLQVAGQAPCGDGVAHDDIDFSGSVSPGHGAFKIRLSAPRYDFYCKMYWNCQATYGSYQYAYGTNCYDLLKPAAYAQVCPSKTVYSTHVVRGALQIRIDNTDFTK